MHKGKLSPPHLKPWSRSELEDRNNWAFGFVADSIEKNNARVPAEEMWNHEMQRELGSQRVPYLLTRSHTIWSHRKPLKAWLHWKPIRIREKRFWGREREFPECEKYARTFHTGPALPSNFEVLFRFDLGAPKDALKDAFAAWLERPEVKELRAQVTSLRKRGKGKSYAEWLRDLAIYRFASAGFNNQEMRARLESEYKPAHLIGKGFDWPRAIRLTQSRINKYWQRWLSLCENDPAFMYAMAAAIEMLFPASLAKRAFPDFRDLPNEVKWIHPRLPDEKTHQ